MEVFALLAFPLLMAISANEAMLAQQRHAAAMQGQPHYAYAPAPGSGFAPGALIGAGIGAIASGGLAGPALAGGLIGGAMGHAATMPPYAPVTYAPVSYAYATAPAAPGYAAGSDRFIENWQGFMQRR